MFELLLCPSQLSWLTFSVEVQHKAFIILLNLVCCVGSVEIQKVDVLPIYKAKSNVLSFGPSP